MSQYKYLSDDDESDTELSVVSANSLNFSINDSSSSIDSSSLECSDNDVDNNETCHILDDSNSSYELERYINNNTSNRIKHTPRKFNSKVNLDKYDSDDSWLADSDESLGNYDNDYIESDSVGDEMDLTKEMNDLNLCSSIQTSKKKKELTPLRFKYNRKNSSNLSSSDSDDDLFNTSIATPNKYLHESKSSSSSPRKVIGTEIRSIKIRMNL